MNDTLLALIAAETRVTPDDIFDPDQLDAIYRAGLSVFFVPADALLGGVR